jgi:ferritin-like metal-binding protein YciE
MEMNNLRDWYVHLLQDSYSAEKQITEALPKMAEAATSAQLKKAFEKHLEVTQTHMTNVEKLLKDMGEKTGGEKCKGMEGLIKEGEDLLAKKGKIDAEVMDAALIASAQKVEHYEISGYGTAAAYAELLGEAAAAKVLHKIAGEEGDADKKLTTLAEASINKAAKSQGGAKGKKATKPAKATTKSNGKASAKSDGKASKTSAKSSSKTGSKSKTSSKSKAGAKA